MQSTSSLALAQLGYQQLYGTLITAVFFTSMQERKLIQATICLMTKTFKLLLNCKIIVYPFLFSLAFSVTMYCCMAICVTIILFIRRHPFISGGAGGELGGSEYIKIFTSVLFICMWMIFVLLSAFQDYDFFQAFQVVGQVANYQGNKFVLVNLNRVNWSEKLSDLF